MAKALKKEFSWFSMKNYEFIDELTIPQLIQELEWRDLLFRYLREEGFDIENDEVYIKYERVFKGDPYLDQKNEDELEINNMIKSIHEQNQYDRGEDLPSLDSKLGVSPLHFAELSFYACVAIDQGIFKRDEEYLSIKTNAMLSSVTGNLDGYFDNRVLAEIDLDEATDEEILTSLKRLLPLWREKLSLPEKPHIAQKRVGIKTLQKLITNRVLPILDLLLWGERFGKEVTNPMLSILVFPDDPKDTQAIKESIKPFAFESMDERYTRLLRLYVNKDGHLRSTKIRDLMRRDL